MAKVLKKMLEDVGLINGGRVPSSSDLRAGDFVRAISPFHKCDYYERTYDEKYQLGRELARKGVDEDSAQILLQTYGRKRDMNLLALQAAQFVAGSAIFMGGVAYFLR